MSYQQLHLGKVKLNGLGGIRHHLLDRDRVKTNPNINLTRSHLNHSIENLSPEHLERNVRQRIKQLHACRHHRRCLFRLYAPTRRGKTRAIFCQRSLLLSTSLRKSKRATQTELPSCDIL